MSVENFCLLCKNQKRLREISLECTDQDLLPILEKEPGIIEGFEKLTDLHLNIDNLDKLKVAHKLLKTYPRVTSIHVGAFFEKPPRDLDDTSTSPGLLTWTLFAHMMPFESCTPFALKQLYLHKVQLRVSHTALLCIHKLLLTMTNPNIVLNGYVVEVG